MYDDEKQTNRDGSNIGARSEAKSVRVTPVKISPAVISVGIFLFVTGIFAASPATTLSDSRWSLHTAMSFVKGNNGALSDYSAIITSKDYSIEYPDGKPRTIYPIGASLLAVPFVAMYEILWPDWPSYLQNNFAPKAEKFVASVIAAAASVVFFWFLLLAFQSLSVALSCTAIFAFATPMWSTASRGLWQHGPLVLMLSVAMLLLIAAKRRPFIYQFVSIPIALAYVMRPTAITSIIVFTAYILLFYKEWFLQYILWASLIAIPWIGFNFYVYHRLVSPYYMSIPFSGETHFFEGLIGNLVSPSRGLFVFSPILLLSITGFFAALGEAKHRHLAVMFGSIVVLHCVIVGSASMWWAGHSFGPRFMTDIVPFLVYFVAANFLVLAHARPVLRSSVISVALVLFVLSAFIHSRGATSNAPLLWNVNPSNVDGNPERAWDWSDPQFMRFR